MRHGVHAVSLSHHTKEKLLAFVRVSNYGMNQGATIHHADVLMSYCAASAAPKLNIKQCGVNDPGVCLLC